MLAVVDEQQSPDKRVGEVVERAATSIHRRGHGQAHQGCGAVRFERGEIDERGVGRRFKDQAGLPCATWPHNGEQTAGAVLDERSDRVQLFCSAHERGEGGTGADARPWEGGVEFAAQDALFELL